MANYKRLFLEGHSYFITIVAHKRNPILTKNIELLRGAFKESKTKYDYKINAIVILPDHLHMIITPKYAKSYPHIISAIKRYFTRHCHPKYYVHLEQSASRGKRNMKPVWQKIFYEHTIKNDRDMHEKLQYMYHNPVKHQYTDNPKKWKYSSFS